MRGPCPCRQPSFELLLIVLQALYDYPRVMHVDSRTWQVTDTLSFQSQDQKRDPIRVPQINRMGTVIHPHGPMDRTALTSRRTHDQSQPSFDPHKSLIAPVRFPLADADAESQSLTRDYKCVIALALGGYMVLQDAPRHALGPSTLRPLAGFHQPT